MEITARNASLRCSVKTVNAPVHLVHVEVIAKRYVSKWHLFYPKRISNFIGMQCKAPKQCLYGQCVCPKDTCGADCKEVRSAIYQPTKPDTDYVNYSAKLLSSARMASVCAPRTLAETIAGNANILSIVSMVSVSAQRTPVGRTVRDASLERNAKTDSVSVLEIHVD